MESRTLDHPEVGSGAALIVEDHPLYRDALYQLLRALIVESKILAASSLEQALQIAADVENVRLVLLDFGLPGLNGIEAVAAVRRAFPAAVIIVVSASENRREANAALAAGARLFISKAVSTEVLADAAQAALTGDLPKQAAWILPDAETTFVNDAPAALTPRQRQILHLLANGCANKEIGLRLQLAEVTVKMHVSAIFRALGVTNRTQAVIAARRSALVDAERAGETPVS